MRTSLITIVVACALAESAHAGPAIHAHRGGSVLAGVPTFAEETMPAFRHAWERERAVLELDVKLTSDRVPVVIHDDTLDRTTDCEGAVSAKTLAQFKACRPDVLGSGGTVAAAPPGGELPALGEALAYARDAGASVNLEIKNLPGDNDFDPSSEYADTVMDAVIASGLPKDRLIVQSFWPPNLDAARAKLPGVVLSYLTLAQANEGGVDFARSRDYDWVSPGGVPSKGYVDRAHAAQLKVVPYTLNQAAHVKDAAQNGVDALITDDPVMARRALGLPEPATAPTAQPAPPVTKEPRQARKRRTCTKAQRRRVAKLPGKRRCAKERPRRASSAPKSRRSPRRPR